MAAIVGGITAQCEVTAYGRYSGSGDGVIAHGRCADRDYADWITQLSPACCGVDFVNCGGHALTAASFQAGLGPNGMPSTCVGGCPALFEAFWSECHPRLEAAGQVSAEAFYRSFA